MPVRAARRKPQLAPVREAVAKPLPLPAHELASRPSSRAPTIMVIAANVLLAIAAVAHVHAAVAATLVSYQVIRKRRRRGKQQRRSAAWSLMHEQLRAPTDEDEDP